MRAAAAPHATGHIERWSASMCCPICEGHPGLPHGQDIRCWGFLSSDERYAHCTRGEYAGELSLHDSGNTYAHRLDGDCRCGLRHGDAAPVAAVRSTRNIGDDRPKLWNIPPAHIEMLHSYELGGVLQFELARIWKRHRGQYGDTTAFPRHLGADGRWYFGQGKWRGRKDKPLYRQDLALNELHLGGHVYIVEGERDADALWDLGLIGTCSGGVGSFRSHHARLIIDAMNAGDDHQDRDAASMAHSTITIVADNDTSGTGLKAARRIYQLLTPNAGLRGRLELALMADGAKDLAEFLGSRDGSDCDG
jgi:hypothetical protein